MVSGLLEVGDNVLENVVRELNYSSIKAFYEDVKKIQEWMEKQPHLPEIMEKKKIQNFLILNKGSIERAKEKIDNYYSVRNQLHQVFDGINPILPHTQQILDSCYLVLSPKLTKEMYRVIIFKTRSRSLMERFSAINGTRYLVNLQEFRLLEDVMYGDIFIVDGHDLPLAFLLRFNPMIVYNAIVTLYEKVFSSRLKAVYFFNVHLFLDKISILLKPMLKSKLYKRIHVLDSCEKLAELVGKEVLPKDYGGDLKSLEELQEMMPLAFDFYKENFDKLDTLRVDEQLRPEERNDELLGTYGNFKKLDID